MNSKIILTALATAVASTASAGLNTTDAAGYLERAVAMYNERNYEGCLDQLNHLALLSPSSRQEEDAAYYAAMANMGMGDDSALELLRGFVGEFPASPRRQDALMSIGDYFFTRSAYADALKAYLVVDVETLDDARAEDYRYRLAYCYMLLGEYEKSASLFNQLLGTSYGNAAQYYIAYLAYARHDYDAALKLFRNVNQTTEPGNAAPYYMAQIYFLRGDYDQALALARKMLAQGALSEFEPECNRLAGESLYNLGHEDEALPYLWKYAARAADPQPSAFYILGLSEYRSGQIDNAIKLLQRAIGQDNAMGQSAYLVLGQAYQRRGDSNAALLAFERAAEMEYDPKVRESAYYNYAVASLDGGRVPFGSSVTLFEEFLRRYPYSDFAPKVQEYIINGYMTDNDYDSALKSIERIQHPSDEILKAKQRVLFMTGTRYYSEGNLSKALNAFNEARQLARYDSSIARQTDIWLGDTEYRLGDYDRAAQSYRAYIEATPASSVEERRLAWYDLGYVRFAQENYNDALIDFNRVVDNPPKSADKAMIADAYNRAGDCLYYLSRFSEAEADYTKAYELSPSSGDYAIFQLAMMKGFNRDYAGKIKTIDQLMNRFPTSGLIPSALLEKADSYVSLGNNPSAIDTYNALVTNYASTAQGRNGYLQLAITYLNSGDRQRAVEAYKKVITAYPSSEEARLAIEDLKRIYGAEGKVDELVRFLDGVKGAPSISPSEIDDITFRAAEGEYVNSGKTKLLDDYLTRFPKGENTATALYYLAEDAWNSGKFAQAVKIADRLLKESPDAEAAEDVLVIKANALDRQGKKELALTTWEQLEEKASGADAVQTARLGIMRLAGELGRYDRVLTVADRLLSSSAASPETQTEVKFYRGLALNRLHRYDEAERQWEEISGNTDEFFGTQAAYELAQSLFDRGKTARAKKKVDELINANPPHQYWLARGFILYSDILRSEGKTFEADEYLRSLRTNYPGTNDDIRTLIDKRLK